MMVIQPDDKLPFPGFGTDPLSVRRRVEALERILERMFVVPGLNRPVGLDVILDLVPIAGSTAAAALGAYMAWEARNLGMSKWQVARMAGNVGVDWLFGLIPWVGAIPDFFFRSNSRNLQDHQAPPRQAPRRHRDHPGRSHCPVRARPTPEFSR